MFDIDEFIGGCREAVRETDPRRAVREPLERAVSEPAAVGEALAPTEGGFTLLHHAPDLTVLHVVWAPGMRIFPHDHQMWAAHRHLRRAGGQRVLPARRTRRAWAHRLGRARAGRGRRAAARRRHDPRGHQPARRASPGAIHVYAGDFVNEPRSQWGPGPVEERPYDIELARRQFAEANAAWRAREEISPREA